MVSFNEALAVVGSGIWYRIDIFFNSPFFLGITTILTVLVVIFIYFRQKEDEKQRIAISLVNEIRNAEDAILTLKKSVIVGGNIPEISILPQNSWNKCSYLFAKDLDEDQMNTVSRFYFEADRADYIVSCGNAFEIFHSNIKNRSIATHQKVLEIIDRSTIKEKIKDDINEFTEKLNEGVFEYGPRGYANELEKHLKNVTLILDTPAGIRLKQLAGLIK